MVFALYHLSADLDPKEEEGRKGSEGLLFSPKSLTPIHSVGSAYPRVTARGWGIRGKQKDLPARSWCRLAACGFPLPEAQEGLLWVH